MQLLLNHLQVDTVILGLDSSGKGIIQGISETLKQVSVSETFDQSRLVSVSTTIGFHSLKQVLVLTILKIEVLNKFPWFLPFYSQQLSFGSRSQS